jgi:hypothetical protein
MKLYGITDLLTSNVQIINNSSFFYIKRTEMLINLTDIFTYFFYNINNKLYINNIQFNDFITSQLINKSEYTTNQLQLLNNIKVNKIYLDNAFFITYTHSNAGHMFSEIMYQIYIYKTHNLYDYKVCITKELYEHNNFLVSIINYFFTDVIIIDDHTLVEFKNSFVVTAFFCKYMPSIDLLINKLKIETNLIKIYNNICLLKTVETQNQNQTKSFDTNYNDFIKNKNYNIIIPENYTITELFNIIYNSDNVIMSWGCCSYLNSIFVNEKSNILILCHTTYNNEYNELKNKSNILESAWLPTICKNKYILYDLPTILDDNIKILLNNEIDKMI